MGRRSKFCLVQKSHKESPFSPTFGGKVKIMVLTFVRRPKIIEGRYARICAEGVEAALLIGRRGVVEPMAKPTREVGFVFLFREADDDYSCWVGRVGTRHFPFP